MSDEIAVMILEIQNIEEQVEKLKQVAEEKRQQLRNTVHKKAKETGEVFYDEEEELDMIYVSFPIPLYLYTDYENRVDDGTVQASTLEAAFQDGLESALRYYGGDF